jgi:hypothetical protein
MRITTQSTVTTPMIRRSINLIVGDQLRTGFPPTPRHLLSRWRNPLGTLPRLDSVEIHGVNFLKSTTLPFDNEEVDDKTRDGVAASEDVAVAEVDGFGDEGCEESEELHRVSLTLLLSDDEEHLRSSRASC